MTELDGICLNIIWIHQKCRRHIFMKVLRWRAPVSGENRCLQMYRLQLDASRKIKVENLSASEKSSMSSNISWECSNDPSFLYTICAFVLIWFGWWAVDFAPSKQAPYFPCDWCFSCSCRTQRLHAVIVCLLHSFKLVQFLENCCEWVLFVIFSATVDRSSLRWRTLGGLQCALSKDVKYVKARGTLRSAWLQIHQGVSKSALCSILVRLEGEKNP